MMQCNSTKCIKIKAEERKNQRGNQEWTIQRHWQRWAQRKNQRGNQEWTIQTLATLGTNDTRLRQNKTKTKKRNTGN